jgi:hypothetical protein
MREMQKYSKLLNLFFLIRNEPLRFLMINVREMQKYSKFLNFYLRTRNEPLQASSHSVKTKNHRN